MGLGFLARMGLTRVEGFADDLTTAAVKGNPLLAIETQIGIKQEEVSAWEQRVVERERALATNERETAEAAAMVEQHNSRLTEMKAMLDGDRVPPDQRDAFIGEAKVVRRKLEQARALHTREQEEDDRDRRLLAQAREGYDTVVASLSTLREQLEQAKSRMESADMQREQAELEAAMAEELSGLSGSIGQTNVALAALTQLAQEDEDAARALELRAERAGVSSTGSRASVFEQIAAAEAEEAGDDPFAGL